MDQMWFGAALWLLLALVAVLLANWMRVSTALSEIVVGVAAQLILGALAGANALGAKAHKSPLTRRDQPIVISIVDSADNLARLAPVVEEMMDTGLFAVSDVRVIRVQKQVVAKQDASGD